jgi:hypothetical protein
VQQVLHTLLLPSSPFAEPTTLLLALALIQSDASGRALALEVLLAAIEHGRLVPVDLGQALGRLLAAEFAPVPRLTDSLAQARALSPRTDAALGQLLEALLPELPPTPPRQMTKLLANRVISAATSPASGASKCTCSRSMAPETTCMDPFAPVRQAPV